MNEWLNEEESAALLQAMFPSELGGDDLMAELCPDGWRGSDLRLALHPTPEQRWREAVALKKRLRELGDLFSASKSEEGKSNKGASGPKPTPLPDREEFIKQEEARGDEQSESDATELGRLVGLCLWDILSDNHDLITPAGRVCHIGSFRATAGIIADFFHGHSRDQDSDQDYDYDGWLDMRMGYMEFYMGTISVAERTELRPVYRCIFHRLKACGYDWKYEFPRLGMIRLKHREPPDGEPDWHNYNPSESFAKEEEQREAEAEAARLQRDLDEIHKESLEHAKNRPEPAVVNAYREIYGRDPRGWPPWEE